MPARVAPWIAALLLVCAAGLAWSAATTDSVTVDEPAHVVAGYASLVTGDHRLSPDHPPLARWLLALPLLAQSRSWPAAETEAWRGGDIFALGREFFETGNEGEKRILKSRAVAICILLALLSAVAWTARELHGMQGALLAMALVAFDPGWLAHGHLATIDVPYALAILSVIACAHRWLERPTPGRLALFALVFAALTLVKLSWVLVVPSLLAMAVVACRKDGPRAIAKTIAVAGATLLLASSFAIWAVYGFRFSATVPGTPPGIHMIVLSDFGEPVPTDPAAAWETLLHDPRTAADRRGLTVPALRLAHSLRLLPEAYLYGVAYVGKSSVYRAAYLRGEYSTNGFASYFPWALWVKTPLPTLLLYAGGLGAMAWRFRTGRRTCHPLAAGLVVFAGVYFLTLVSSGLNLGYRHLLPVTAVLAIAAGGLAPTRFPARWRRPLAVAIGLALVWLVVGTLAAAPHWIGYFNEAAGGWRQGHRHLLDSNLDWGQDLLRLRERLAGESEAPVWLAQAGDPPLPSGVEVRWLWGAGDHAPDPAPIAGGLYVVSATELLGLYRPLARSASWRDSRLLQHFEHLYEQEQAANVARTARASVVPSLELEALRRLRLVARLAERLPDERIGTSLFLFRLSDAQVAEWTTP